MGLVLLALTAAMGPVLAQEADIATLQARLQAACPLQWEALTVEIDPTQVTGDVWAGDGADRSAFTDFVAAEMGASAPDPAGLEAMADDLPTVAAECATQRLSLLDALIARLPGDVLRALNAVADELAAALAAVELGGWQVGDVRFTGRAEAADGWLFLSGQRLGADGSGADLAGEDYRELFELARSWAPNSGAEDFDAGDLVQLPDGRGRALAGADAMGGTAAGVLAAGAAPGAATHTLTSAEMPSHSHSMNSAGSHTHRVRKVTGPSGANGIDKVESGFGNDWHSGTVEAAGAHTHSLSSSGGAQPHAIVQPTLVLNVEMKYR
jgi:microcystin-dependent protein